MDRWIGFTQPVRLSAQGRTTVMHAEVVRVSPALAADMRARYGAAVCDLTPRATLGDVAPAWPRRLAATLAGDRA